MQRFPNPQIEPFMVLPAADRRSQVGAPYLRFDNGDWFLMAGTDSPENLLAYDDIDGTYGLGPDSYIKSCDAHLGDGVAGDPVWKNGKGKGLIGAIIYLSSESVNGAFFILVHHRDRVARNDRPR